MAVLTIRNISKNDAGLYLCRKSSVVIDRIQLNVFGEPILSFIANRVRSFVIKLGFELLLCLLCYADQYFD